MRARSHRYQDEKDTYIDTTHYDPKTKNLDIGYQRLKIFNIKSYPDISKIRSLFIDHNNLTILPDPSQLPHLIELNCSNNRLKNIQRYQKLEYLNIAYNKITTLDMYNNSNLTYLDCSFNQDLIFNIRLDLCKHLYINDTFLHTINLLLTPILEFLDCSNNKLNKITKCDTLVELNIQYNHILELPQLPNLRVLMADNNLLTNLVTYKNLENLTITYNKLINIDAQPKLTKIVATHNFISKMGKMPNLELIDMSHNKIQNIDIPNVIKYLSIQFNPITELKIDESAFENIKEIQVDFKIYKNIYNKYYNYFKSVNIRVSTDKITEKLYNMEKIFDAETIEYIKSAFLNVRFQDRDEMFFKVSLKIYCKYIGCHKNETIINLIKSNEFLFLLENISNLYYKTIIATLFFIF